MAGTGSSLAFWIARSAFSFAVVSCGSSFLPRRPFLPLGRPFFFGTTVSSGESTRTADYYKKKGKTMYDFIYMQ
jgi:hypothetical protein